MAALTEEQMLLKEQAASWARDEAPVAKFREMRALPRPDRPVPIWIGGLSDPAIDRVNKNRAPAPSA